MIKIIECPRDAMQGIKTFISTDKKAAYINQLLNCGFDTIDFGSFVSPKAIPQMRDTAKVLSLLNLDNNPTKLLAIIANMRGAKDAVSFDEIDYLGYPFSISETFQLRNTNATIEESLERVEEMQKLCISNGKKLVVYVSMGFGNPYGDPWNFEIVSKWVKKLSELGVGILSLSDTIGVSNPENISYLFENLVPAYPNIEFGAHLHTTPNSWKEKVNAAYHSGCLRFDGALKGYGGCPMAKDSLTGNMPTENMSFYFEDMNEETGIRKEEFLKALIMAGEVFPEH